MVILSQLVFYWGQAHNFLSVTIGKATTILHRYEMGSHRPEIWKRNIQVG